MMRKKQDAHWMSISDMMSALMIIFMFIAIAFMIKVQKQQESIHEAVVKYSEKKKEIYTDLKNEFKEKELKEWNAEINPDKLVISFNEPEVLFKSGSYILEDKFKEILKDFMPRYIGILSQEKFASSISEVRIEGHTSSEWKNESDLRKAYFNNMELSQKRTRSVLVYTMNLPALADKEEWLKRYITANGLSSSQLIRKADGSEDYDKSRRVEFRVRTTADDKLVEMEQYTK